MDEDNQLPSSEAETLRLDSSPVRERLGSILEEPPSSPPAFVGDEEAVVDPAIEDDLAEVPVETGTQPDPVEVSESLGEPGVPQPDHNNENHNHRAVDNPNPYTNGKASEPQVVTTDTNTPAKDSIEVNGDRPEQAQEMNQVDAQEQADGEEDELENPLELDADAEADEEDVDENEEEDNQVNGKNVQEENGENDEANGENEQDNQDEEDNPPQKTRATPARKRAKKGETQGQPYQEARAALAEIHQRLVALRKRQVGEELELTDIELSMCEKDIHPQMLPTFLRMKKRCERTVERLGRALELQTKYLGTQTRASRAHIHQQFIKERYELRQRLLSRTTREWYKVNYERRAADNLAPEYGYSLDTQTEGVSAAPSMATISEQELVGDFISLGRVIDYS